MNSPPGSTGSSSSSYIELRPYGPLCPGYEPGFNGRVEVGVAKQMADNQIDQLLVWQAVMKTMNLNTANEHQRRSRRRAAATSGMERA